jgi:hypothetical protein
MEITVPPIVPVHFDPPRPSRHRDRPGGRMSASRVLTPREAEAVIEERIDKFGLGALPQVTVTELPDGNWRVHWEHLESVVAPMTEAAWHDWLEQNVGSLDAGDLETTES